MRKKRARLLSAMLALCFLSVCIFSSGQFTDVTIDNGLVIYSDITVSESGVSFHDFDRDGWDDLTYAGSGNGVFTFRNTGSGFEQAYYFAGITGKTLHPIWVDYDNDGDADFFATRAYECPVLFRNNGDMTFEDVSSNIPCPESGIISTTASWGDYDNDGWLDLYVANYNHLIDDGAPNWLFRSLGDGTFEEVGESAGVAYGNFPAYQCLFLDVDFDHDQDLLVVNDKGMGCKYYRNEGGYFSEIGVSNGFDVHIDAMSLSVADIDHDGDYDFYISNTIEGNVLLINEDGLYVDHADEWNGLVNASCWGTVFIDTQMKTWEDVYVVSTGPETGMNVLLQNLQGNGFNSSYTTFDQQDQEFAFAVAKGDIDNDGAYDVMSMPYFANGSLLFQSQLESFTYVKVGVQGTVSNHDGIGATLHCYSDGNHFIRPVTCGENFTSQDSQHFIFGLNGMTVVDSMSVQWPSGWVDSFYNLNANETYLFVEGETVSMLNALESYTICSGDSLWVDPGEGSAFVWENGDTSATRWITEAGNFEVTITNAFGFNYTKTYQVENLELPSIGWDITGPSCYGVADGMAQLSGSVEEVAAVYWDGTAVTEEISTVASGDHSYEIAFNNGCSLVGIINVGEPEPLFASSALLSVCPGNTAQAVISISGGTGMVSVDWYAANPDSLSVGEYPFLLTDENGCEYMGFTLVSEYDAPVLSVEAAPLCFNSTTTVVYDASGGAGDYSFSFSGEDPLNVTEGTYIITVTDGNGCIAEEVINLEANTEIIPEVEIEHATDETEGTISIDATGGMPPYTFLWSTGDVLDEISSLEPGWYSCEVLDAMGCSVTIDVELLNLHIEEKAHSINVYPQPFETLLNFELPFAQYVSIYNASGKLIWQEMSAGRCAIKTTDWVSGVYCMRTSAGGVFLLIKG